MEGKTFTTFSAWTPPSQDVWATRFQRLQRGLKSLFPAGVATPLSPIYVTVAQFYVEKERDISWILQGIANAFNKLADSLNMRPGG